MDSYIKGNAELKTIMQTVHHSLYSPNEDVAKWCCPGSELYTLEKPSICLSERKHRSVLLSSIRHCASFDFGMSAILGSKEI